MDTEQKMQASPVLYMYVHCFHVWRGNIGPSESKILYNPVNKYPVLKKSLLTNN